MQSTNGPFRHYGAFESTRIHGSGTDVLETTRHLHKWREDLDLLRATGLNNLRYPAPWHRIEPSPGVFDFTWMDQPMNYMRQKGMKPVMDLVHHTSFPDWLQNGFANPAFPELFHRFVQKFARRYEWVDSYTIFNEPLATTLLCSLTGTWYPWLHSDPDFVHMGHNVCRAIALGERALRGIQPGFVSVYTDTCEHHVPYDRRSEEWVDFANARRFWMLDLLLGRITRIHPLFDWVTRLGLSPDQLRRFEDERVRIDVLGLDYYYHSEMTWRWDNRHRAACPRWPTIAPRGFSETARDYIERYRLPIMLAETNLRGTVTDRLTWLRFMHEQCEALVDGDADFRGFCWFPSIDSTDWSNLCARCTRAVDPQGIWYLDSDRNTRWPSELSECYGRLVSGAARAKDLPAYLLLPPVDRQLSGYLRLMSHWDCWREVNELEQSAA